MVDSNILDDDESADEKEDMDFDDRGCVRVRIPGVERACTKGFAGKAAASVTRLRRDLIVIGLFYRDYRLEAK